MSGRVTGLIFVAMCALFGGVTLLWLWLNRSIPTWDDAIYLTKSLQMYDALREGGLWHYAATFLTIMDIKPPLIAALPTPIYLIVGRHPRAAASVNLLFMLVLFTAVFRLARKSSSNRAGLLAVYFLATMPMMYGLARWYLVDFALSAIVAAAIDLLWEHDRWRQTALFLSLGCMCGLGVLTKFTFPLYLLAPCAYFLFLKRGTIQAKSVTLFIVPAIALGLPWYVLHIRSSFQTAIETGSADATAQFFGTSSISPYSLAVLFYYFSALFNAGLLLYFLALPVLLLAKFTDLPPKSRAGLKWCAVWVAPFLFLVIWPSREIRYAAPLFSALAIALAVLTDAALSGRGKWSHACCAMLLALPLVSMLQVSFGIFGNRRIELGGLLLRPALLAYASRYDQRHWPQGEILADLCHAAACSPRQEQTVLVATDTKHFNADNFKLAAALGKLPVRVLTTAYETQWSAVVPLLESAAFVLHEQGGERESNLLNQQGGRVLRTVQDSDEFTELPLSRRLPDGGVVHVFQKLTNNAFFQGGALAPARIRGLHDCQVTFADRIELNGVGVNETGGRLVMRFRWRCLRSMIRNYWCFVHILGEKYENIGNVDHLIVNNEPPLTAWKEGDVALENLRFSLPAPGPSRCYRIELGMYDPAAGTRLPISRSDFHTADQQTAAIVPSEQNTQVVCPVHCPDSRVTPAGCFGAARCVDLSNADLSGCGHR